MFSQSQAKLDVHKIPTKFCESLSIDKNVSGLDISMNDIAAVNKRKGGTRLITDAGNLRFVQRPLQFVNNTIHWTADAVLQIYLQ